MATLKVAIVGAGAVGTTLGKALTRRNAAVITYGTRDPTSDKSKKILEDQPTAKVGTIQDSIAWADAVILTTPGKGTEEAVKELAASLLPAIKGKVLLDATNPLSPWPGLEIPWGSKSAGEMLAEALPDTFVYKAFNTIGENLMGDADTSFGEPLTMLYAGPDGAPKAVAEQVIAGTGFKPTWVGSIRYARNLEAIAELWIHLGVPGIGSSDKWGRNFNFQAIRK